MPTLTGFTRPSDPINAVDMGIAISTAIGKTVTCVVTQTDIQVTGSTISGADTSNIQAAMTAYFYAYLQYGAPISDNPTMSGTQHGRGVTEAVAYVGDLAALTLATAASNKVQSGSTVETGAWPILRKASTNSSGVATIYLTTDGTSGTAAAFSTVYEDGIVVMPIGSSSNYQVVSLVLDASKKFITVTVNQLGSVVLGLVNVTSAAAGVEVRAAVWGK